MSVLLTAEPIWFSFTWLFLIGLGKVFYNYFRGGYHPTLPRKIRLKNLTLKLKMGLGKGAVSNSTHPSTSALRGL